MKNSLQFMVFLLIAFTHAKAQFMAPNYINRDSDTYTSSFIAEWAGDTASIETYTINGNHLYGRAIHLYPEPHLRQFNYYFNSNGSIRTMDVLFFNLENTSLPLKSRSGFLPYRITMTAVNEVIDFRVVDKEGEKQYTHLSKRMDFFGGWVPIFGQWQWLTDLISENKLDKDLKFLNYVIGDYDMQLTKKADNSIVFDSDITASITFFLDNNNKIEKIDGIGSPWNYLITRHDPIDIENYSKHFAKKEVIGDPSPHERFEVKISDALLEIDYGRPSKRGREIYGNVVPYGKVWRTGAGTPTMLTTDKDLVFNGVTIPKGSYNLFTIPNKDSWKLIFNTEKEAWGSAYRKEFDFAEVNMTVKEQEEEVEKFMIEIIPQEKGKGLLKFIWDKTLATAEFKILD